MVFQPAVREELPPEEYNRLARARRMAVITQMMQKTGELAEQEYERHLELKEREKQQREIEESRLEEVRAREAAARDRRVKTRGGTNYGSQLAIH